MDVNNINDFKTLDQIDGIEVKIIGKDFIPIHHANYNLIAGNGGTGKSLISLKMICHFLIEFPSKKALGIFSEDTKADIVNRLNNITHGMNITTRDVMSRTYFKTLDNDDGAVFCSKVNGKIIEDEYLTKFKINLIKHDVGLVILDPLERFHNGLLENNEGDMKYFTVMLQKIAIDAQCAIVLLHHTAKGNNGGFRGSSVIANKGRVAYNIRKNYTVDKNTGIDTIREGWEFSVILTTIKDNHYVARYCDIIQNAGGKLDLPVHAKKHQEIVYNYAPVEIEKAPIIEKRETVFISIANHNDEKNPHGFSKREIAWDDLIDVMSMGRAYSPSIFANGHRHKDNFLGGNNIVFLDIDDGMTIEEAQTAFKTLKCIILTTKSHRKEKNGITCDRYRVAIMTKEPINLNAEDYRDCMSAIFEFFGGVADRATKDPARFFYSSPSTAEVYYINGSEKLDWRSIYDRRRKLEQIEKQYRASQPQREYEKGSNLDDVSTALSFIPSDVSYQEWIECAMALKSEFGDQGFELWNEWSSRGNKYPGEKALLTKYNSFTANGISIGTLFFIAKTYGYQKDKISANFVL